jgi:hypothetical protein
MQPSKSLSTHIVKGSMLDEAKKSGQSLASTWMNCKRAVICDGSGSMSMCDSRGGRSRFEVLKDELIKVQGENPGAIAVISFSEYPEWNADGMPVQYGGGTRLDQALEFVKMIDDTGIGITVISDGEPDDPRRCINIAKTFKTHIDTIYVGPENEHGGRDFLAELAKACGGVHQDDFKVNQLASKVGTLLIGSGNG